MRLYVFSRNQIEKFNPSQEDHIIISLRNPHSEMPKIVINEHTIETISFECDDTDRKLNPTDAMWHVLGRDPILFSEDMASEIVQKIFQHKPKAVVVHCEAGQSRSAGVAAAVAKYFNDDDTEFFNNYGMYGGKTYTPNMLIYRLTLNALVDQDKSNHEKK